MWEPLSRCRRYVGTGLTTIAMDISTRVATQIDRRIIKNFRYMPDELLKEEFDNLPSQQPVSQPNSDVASELADASETQAKFNPSGQVEDIFENTEKPDNLGGQAGFKVKPSTGHDINPELKPESRPQSQSVAPKPKPAVGPAFTKGPAAISRPQPASLTQDSEFDDEPVSSKKKYFIIGLIGIIIIAGTSAYWFFFRETVTETSNGQIIQEEQESFFDRVAAPIDPQSPLPVTESGNDDIISSPEPDNEIIQVNTDSDQDGLSDEEEASLGTNPLKADSDNDGLFDREEVKVYLTDPTDADTDNDGYLDGEEVVAGFNPKGTGSFLPPVR